ncbi:MAG: ribonuclease HII [Bacillota bacterium]
MEEFSNYTIKEIKKHLKKIKVNEKTIKDLASDSRKGVQKLAKKYKKIEKRKKALKEKWERMNSINEMLREKGYEFICGLDEAGRGPLAGPVVASAVLLDPFEKIIGLDDSKKISEKRREELFEEINKKAISVGIGIVENDIIDEINIQQASFKAMKKAIKELEFLPDYLLVDGNREIPEIDILQKTVIDGDAKVNSIAAASIIAKVTRDRIIESYDNDFPQYGFAQNKGYGTKEHINALKKYGPTPIHRYSYSVVNENA